MKKFMIHGILSALISSIAGGLFLKFYYSLELDQSEKVLPIWKVIAIYISLSLLLSLILFQAKKILNNLGVIMVNTILSIVTTASIVYPITYVNQNLDTTFIAVAAIPVHFIMPMIWMALQPIIFNSNNEK